MGLVVFAMSVIVDDRVPQPCRRCRRRMQLAVLMLVARCHGCGRDVGAPATMVTDRHGVFRYCSEPCAWRCGSQVFREALRSGTSRLVPVVDGYCRRCVDDLDPAQRRGAVAR